jgi:hypothetical protein
MMSRRIGTLLVLAALAACGGRSAGVRVNSEAEARARANERARSLGDTSGDPESATRCEVGADRESSEYDTSGDHVPDVRKVFKVMGTPPTVRLVLVCRESDLNADGKKDVVRYYNDEGRPMREEADRNFDGMMDEVTYFQDGQIVRKEVDSDANGIVDLKTFFDAGKPQRAEADLAGRSTASEWKPNRWEYFEANRMVRMGTDLDGDGRVDRWDRDEEFKREQREAQEAAAATVEDGESADEESDQMSAQ